MKKWTVVFVEALSVGMLLVVSVCGVTAQAVSSAQSAQQNAPIKIPPAPVDSSASLPPRQAPDCSPMGNRYVPIESTIVARVSANLDSAHLKPGRKVWVNSVYEDRDPECKVVKGAVIYGSVTSSSSRKSGPSELGLQFDRVECYGRPVQPMKLTVIAIVAPEGWRSDTVHDALPGAGGGVDGEWSGWDQSLDPGGPPNFVHPGEVVRLKDLQLDPRGGPACSDKLTSTGGSINLAPGTTLILALSD